tara:strand:+ start:1336 stop:1743 length:408 start_codon:yes stop_codon:yes gene_type:complete
MPRAKPRHIDVLRIEMGTKERQMFEDALIGYQVKSIGTPLVALLSDVSAMSLLITAYAVYKYGDDALNYFRDEAYEDLQDLYKDFMNVAKGLPIIRQGVGFVDTIQEIFDFTPAQPDAYWNQPGYDPSMQGGRTR